METPSPATLITGASSGIGRAAAVRLSRDRALILHGRSEERLEETRQLCADSNRHALWTCDLREPAQAAASLAALLAGQRKVEAFVHCAGMVSPLPVRSVDSEALQETLNVNFIAAAAIVHTLLKRAVNGRALRDIVFVSSIFSRFGARGHSAYCASKAALDGWMRALAVELAPAIRVNSILPGAVPTPMAREGLDNVEIASRLDRDYPLGLGSTDDIAGMLDFLLSPHSRWMTGQQITIDGGRTVNMSLT